MAVFKMRTTNVAETSIAQSVVTVVREPVREWSAEGSSATVMTQVPQ
jgi:hypothetical protein